MTIYAVIPVHNRIELTLQFLDSLDTQDIDEDVRVLIVDDGSTDGTGAMLQQRKGRFPVDVIKGDGNLWWAGAVQKALALIADRIQTGDWLYLGNNDTVLDVRHLQRLLDTAMKSPGSLVGSRSFEVWPDGSWHPVSSGFCISLRNLSVTAIPGALEGQVQVDALCGRGILIPAAAVPLIRLQPALMPQHFADLHITSSLRRKGFGLIVDNQAVSVQTDRASSAVELEQTNRISLSRKDPLYFPALCGFWLYQFWMSSQELRFVKRNAC